MNNVLLSEKPNQIIKLLFENAKYDIQDRCYLSVFSRESSFTTTQDLSKTTPGHYYSILFL